MSSCEALRRARACYADVIEELERYVPHVDMEVAGNELLIVIPLAEDHYISIAGRYSLPSDGDRSELGGWSAVYIDDVHGQAEVIYSTVAPDGEPSGDLSVEPLAYEVGTWANGWRAEHQ